MPSDIERLIAIEDIHQLKARYFRCMDTKDWAGYEAVFSPDAELDVTGEKGRATGAALEKPFKGAKIIADFVRSQIDHVTTVHHGHMGEIELTGPDSARGIWAMEDMLRWPEGSPGIKWMHGYGHYVETYRRIAGRWHIQTTKLTRLRVDAE